MKVHDFTRLVPDRVVSQISQKYLIKLNCKIGSPKKDLILSLCGIHSWLNVHLSSKPHD